MAPISMAELKLKASKAKDASVSSFQNTRDRYQSVPLAKSKFDPHGTNPQLEHSPRSSLSTPDSPGTRSSPPPPLASRHSAPRAGKPAPPPPRRSGGTPSYKGPQESDIDWTNLSEEDKESFFSWLDEYFTQMLGFKVGTGGRATSPPPYKSSAPSLLASPPRRDMHESQPSWKSSPPLAPPRPSGGSPSLGPPPRLASWSKPKLSPTPSTTDVFSTSYPPPTEYDSAALDLAHYFHPSTPWDSAWYNEKNPLPPPLRSNGQIKYLSSWETLGTNKTAYICVMFADLSICWAVVKFTTNGTGAVTRSAKYLPRPKPMSTEKLVAASETYGEYIAVFAENYEASGEFCARGECWDLANEALKWFAEYDYIPEPVPSLSRTHGHLIFEGKANGLGRTSGRWRGGDDTVRRGDIVEWRKVKINTVGARAGSWAQLGDPDHTAIIVRNSKPTILPKDGERFDPADLVSLEVVEQSLGSPPARKVYDMRAFEEGEMWIYRPVGMEEYVGVLLAPRCPPTVHAMSL